MGTMQGRVALVTGASRGIGAATAQALADEGARVVLAARDERALQAVADQITARGGSAIVVPTDVSDPDSVCQVARTLGAYGRLDVAVNNAAGGGHRPTPRSRRWRSPTSTARSRSACAGCSSR
ncbi:SDR family NAD(P)-dependent oxidoreductase [Fodinicola feengrottensis]|uniref:SDR family NAD(P)-dependent oxidoreductase n=1 Tax=Fodinicola feengrottensis TaxID=435914 RepID=UPI002441442E|nr:SDR family NAD(P)-dependent oxidoreductase [Fodinicola feengrottensis]